MDGEREGGRGWVACGDLLTTTFHFLHFQGPFVQRKCRLFDADGVEGGTPGVVQGISARLDSNGAVEFDFLVVVRAHQEGVGCLGLLSGCGGSSSGSLKYTNIEEI